MPLEELLATEVHAAAEDYRQKQREELATFLNTRAGADADGSEFMAMLEKSKVRFGPHAVTLADAFFKAQLKRHAARTDAEAAQEQEQERISFVKMEYFLYGVTEADRLVGQVRGMEDTVNALADELEDHQRAVQVLEEEL